MSTAIDTPEAIIGRTLKALHKTEDNIAASINTNCAPQVAPINAAPGSILVEAESLVHGPRQASYGHPADDYGCVVEMFNAWMDHKHPDGWNRLSVEDAITFMVFVKLSRQANKPKRDNLVDAAGYLECLNMTLERMAIE